MAFRVGMKEFKYRSPSTKRMPKKLTALERHGSYFVKWMHQCKKIKADEWQRASKITQKVDKKTGMVITTEREFPPVKIADMHVMQLVNAIKWCIRVADKELNRNLYGHFDESRATLLAQVPQWKSLLEEAKKRELKMISGEIYGIKYAPWFEAAYSTTVLKDL